MKKFVAVLIVILSMVSCSSDETNSKVSSSYYGRWNLSKYTTTFVLAIYVYGEPQWQEFYDFNQDNTFVKTRIQNNKKTTASGTFSIITIQNETHFVLNYANKSDIIGSCSGDLSEDLYLNNEGSLVSTWQNCDGPGMEYTQFNSFCGTVD